MRSGVRGSGRGVRSLAVAVPLVVGALVSACRKVPVPPPVVPAPAPDAVLARVSLHEPLEHRWADEIVHVDLALPADPGPVHLVDGAGAPLPLEIEPASRADGRRRAWTVITLEPNATATLEVRAGPGPAAPGAVAVRRVPGGIVLANDRVEIAIPTWPDGAPDLRALPAPIKAVRRPGRAWVGDAAWGHEGAPIAVRDAETTVIAEGPVRAAVRQRLRFVDGGKYEAVIALGARQEAATITEDADAIAPQVGYRLALPGGVLWHNQYGPSEGAASWALVETPPAADGDRAVCKLRPWSFWWYPRLSEWAGFRDAREDTLVGVIALRPSRWSPSGWDGFDRTELPITARRGGRADVAFALTADRGQPLHREWAISAAAPPPEDTPAARGRVLRAQLVKHGEFPLDEVLGFGFDAPIVKRPHPSLLFDAAAVARARRQAQTSPVLAARVREAVTYIGHCGDLDPALEKGGPAALYRVYAFHYLYEMLPEAYLGTGDPRYARLLAAAVEGLAHHLVETFLEAPERPALGAYGPWFSEDVTRLVLNWDLVADLLPRGREAAVRRAMIFGAHVLAHPDYWNTARGLVSANPNMTSAILLPRGLLGVALAGHPEADGWLRDAEAELGREIDAWVSPGGAWIESPGYQPASLDGMFLLAQAIRNATGRDAFASPKLRDTLDYFGFLLTAPDRRFAPQAADPPMVLPSIGNTFAGTTTPFNGWMAAATAGSDPAFSARQQFYWKRQASMYGASGRAKGFVPALTDPDLPEAPPAETGRAFPGFGSVLRSSWTDPRQSYVAHRTGPNEHHYEPGEHGSIVYYAKGAPLCLDWGNLYSPVRRSEAWYHNAVSFEVADPARITLTGAIAGVTSLSGFVESSHGTTRGGGGQESDRHLLLVESADPMGANYLVIRDHTGGGPPGQRFFYNLFCLARPPVVRPGEAHFPGQMGVDLDTFILSPARAPITTDHWGWSQRITTWGDFREEQHGIHVMKEGSREDFFTVLYPRTPVERPPRVRALAGGAAAAVDHAEGADVVLLSPGRPAAVREYGAAVTGEIALARRYRSGAIRLAVVAGADASAELGGWGLRSAGAAALEIVKGSASGVSSGDAHGVVVTLPAGQRAAIVRIDGEVVTPMREGRALVIAMPAGQHRFAISPR